MSLSQRVCKTLGMLCLVVPAVVFGQASYVREGSEYAPTGHLLGDQVYPSISINTNGGYLVWEDNYTDGDGLGISAIKLDSSFSSPFGVLRVNQQGAFDQEKPQVAMLKNGGAVFVWQGGKQGFQHIYARFLSASNTWVSGDIMVNGTTNFYQMNPVVTSLANGNVIVAWSSFGQDLGMQGVYAQQLTPAGAKVGAEIPVNQFTAYNQRTPAIAALSTGGFVLTWVSENQRTGSSVDIYARTFNASAAPLGNEFRVNTGTNICANPSTSGASDGTFVVVWGEKDLTVRDNSWDVFARRFSGGSSGGTVARVNTQQYGEQFGPHISGLGGDYMVVWTSLAQDGSYEGVYGQCLHSDGTLAGAEFRVNTTTVNQQMQPAVTSDGSKRFLVVWTSYFGGPNSFDLYTQRFTTYQEPLLAPAAPFVTPVTSSRLSAAWPVLGGFSVDHWNLFIDGSLTPVAVTTNYYTVTGLSPTTTHSFRLSYALADGRTSPMSPLALGTTWGEDNSGAFGSPDGLPDDWQALYWGSDPANWPAPNTKLASDGPTVLQVFLSGGNPLDPATWFKAGVTVTSQGTFLSWNTQPGCIYQVLVSTNLASAWSNLGSPRFAAGTNDSVNLGGGKPAYYRVSRLRY